MTHVSESIEIGIPAERLYALFDDPKSLPDLVPFIKSVEVKGPDLTHWVVEALGRTKEFDARRVVSEPPHRARWESAGGFEFAIEAKVEAVTPTSSRFFLEADFDAGPAEKLGLAKIAASKFISSELKKVKSQLEGANA